MSAGIDGGTGARHRLLAPLRPYFRQVTGLLVIGSAAGIVMNLAAVLPAVLLGRAVDTVLAYSRDGAPFSDVTHAVAMLVAGTLATEVPRIGKRYWLGVAKARIRASLRADAVRGVLDRPAGRLHRTTVGDVITRVIGDVEVVGTGVGEIIVESWDTVLFSVALVAAMLWYDPTLSLWALAPVPAALVLAKLTGAQVARRTLAARQADTMLTQLVQEGLTGVRLLTAYGRRAHFTERVGELARQRAAAELTATRLDAALAPVYATVVTAGVVLVVWIGGNRVAGGALTLGGFVAFLQLFVRFTGRAHRIPLMVNRLQSAAAAFSRLAPLLADNLTLGDPHISAQQVHRAATLTGADTFIRALPHGYDTLLSGTQLSTGQRQLIALTRAVVHEPAVLLLDEATASIDGASDAALRAALHRLATQTRTGILTVAHRLSTARQADRIIVLDGGTVVEQGTPDHLIAAGGWFAGLTTLDLATVGNGHALRDIPSHRGRHSSR